MPTNRFVSAVERLKARLSDKAGSTVIYRRTRNGITSECVLRVWQGRTVYRIEDNGNSRVEWGDRDYLIPVEGLILESLKVTPMRGDRIVETFEGSPVETEQFEISAPDNEQPWRYSDFACTLFRVHTKRMRS